LSALRRLHGGSVGGVTMGNAFAARHRTRFRPSFDRCEERFLAMNFAGCIFGLDAAFCTNAEVLTSCPQAGCCAFHIRNNLPLPRLSTVSTGLLCSYRQVSNFVLFLHSLAVLRLRTYVHTYCPCNTPYRSAFALRHRLHGNFRNAELRAAGYVSASRERSSS